MFSVDLSTRQCDGHVVVALRGELDLVDAAGVADALVTVAAREPTIIVDLSALEFIDARGVAALACGRAQARLAGGDLLLAAPRRLVLRVLTITGLVDDFSVHTSVAAAAARVGRSPLGSAARNLGLPERSSAAGGGRRARRKRPQPPQPRCRAGNRNGWPGYPVGRPRRGGAGSCRGVPFAGCADDR